MSDISTGAPAHEPWMIETVAPVGLFRWLTYEAIHGTADETVTNTAFDAYWEHLHRLTATLAGVPPIGSPEFSLHDGWIDFLRLDLPTRTASLTIVVGNIQPGYRRLTLRYENAQLRCWSAPALAAILGAVRPTDLNAPLFEVIEDEWDAEDDAFVHRFRLWPLGEFAIGFAAVSHTAEEIARRELVVRADRLSCSWQDDDTD